MINGRMNKIEYGPSMQHMKDKLTLYQHPKMKDKKWSDLLKKIKLLRPYLNNHLMVNNNTQVLPIVKD